jgi:hypothetical protein
MMTGIWGRMDRLDVMWWARLRVKKEKHMSAKEILKMIEAVDSSREVNEINNRLDEIDFMAMQYLYPKLGLHKHDHVIVDSCGVRIRADYYTRSRDALKAIRPDGYFNYSASSHGICNFVLFKDNTKIESADCKTEELAELHAIIQAIEHDRLSQ